MVRKITYLILMLITAAIAAAAEPHLSVELDMTEGSLADTYTMRIVVEGAGNAGTPLLSGGEDFSLQYLGPEISTTIINGQVSQSRAFVYQLTPKKEGELKTPQVEIKIDGKAYQADFRVISVKGGSPLPRGINSKDYFVEQYAPGEIFFVGEQIPLNIRIYETQSLRDARMSDATYDGFWQEKVKENSKTVTERYGRRYFVTSVDKTLFPLRAGQLEIPQVEVQAKIVQAQSPRYRGFPGMDDFWNRGFPDIDQMMGFGKLVPLTLISEKLELTVKDLPPPGQILLLWGASMPLVGETSLQLKYDPAEIAVGDSKTVTIRLRSRGNLRPFTKVPLADTSMYRVYQEEPQIDAEQTSDGVIFSRNFRLALVPLSGGQVRIPPLQISWFDPGSSSYKLARSEEISFFVQGPVAPQQLPAQPASSPAVTASTQPQAGETYVALRWYEQQLQKIGSGMLLLLLSILAGFLVIIRLYRRPEAAVAISGRQLKKNLSSCSDLRELVTLTKTGFASRLGTEDTGSAQLKALVRRQVADKDLQLAALLLLDEMDEALYSPATDKQQIYELRTKVLRLFELW